ncbi:two-component system response regulator DesR [Kitasatospora sp. MAA4]|uniref:response regulator transcription factor n=1 Tax=Kitasatospora sp. MAA4 TaxID=3035093 RepID=UPI002474D60E|nr:response regulator transcription factor [Kitasatospora sp. MAA4]MDH6137909.1 two-component system response regulator DesR [Kitasatospora sp. MAA4]
MSDDDAAQRSLRIMIVEDQEVVLGALAALIDLEPDFEVVAEVVRADQVLAAARVCRPDVVLMDIELPGGDGLTATGELRSAIPGVTVLILTTFGRPGYLLRAFREGAAGFLSKDTPVFELADAIRRARRGERIVDPQLAAEAMEGGPNPLLPREINVLRTAADGTTLSEVARLLHLSPGTIRNYLSSAIAKTGTANRIEAARVAAERGWL